jgi:hypothetical protein
MRAQQASKRNDDFVSRAGKIAARILGVPLEDLLSDELRQQRQALRLAWGAAVGLLLLAGVAGLAGILARQQRDQALVSQSRFLADLSEKFTNVGDFYTGTLLALEALPYGGAAGQRPFVIEAEKALYRSLQDSREIATFDGKVYPQF